MLAYTLKRLLAGVITVWFIATATFIAMHNVPGDPLMNDKAVTAEIRANLEANHAIHFISPGRKKKNRRCIFLSDIFTEFKPIDIRQPNIEHN